jgi:tRNA threonylcarbamoyladenosine biosynthesis protein TsaB
MFTNQNCRRQNYGYKPLSEKRLQYIIHFLQLSIMMPLNLAAKILAFDTSSKRGSVSLLEGKELRAELRLNSLQTHSTLLLSSIDLLLKRASWTLQDLNLITVGIGPGSFTGIRIGIATALGFAHSLSIPYIGISGLDALAHQVSSLEGRIGALLDAHRSQVYYAEYDVKKGKIRSVQKSMLVHISDLERHLVDRHLYIVGDVNACLPERSAHLSTGWPRHVSADLYLAASMGELAFMRKRLWRSSESIMAEPAYIRPPDALKSRKH